MPCVMALLRTNFSKRTQALSKVQTSLSAYQAAPLPRVQETRHHENSRHPRVAGSSLHRHNKCWCASESGLLSAQTHTGAALHT